MRVASQSPSAHTDMHDTSSDDRPASPDPTAAAAAAEPDVPSLAFAPRMIIDNEGNLVVDTESLVVEARSDEMPLEQYGTLDGSNDHLTSSSFLKNKRDRSEKWSKEETDRFYQVREAHLTGKVREGRVCACVGAFTLTTLALRTLLALPFIGIATIRYQLLDDRTAVTQSLSPADQEQVQARGARERSSSRACARESAANWYCASALLACTARVSSLS